MKGWMVSTLLVVTLIAIGYVAPRVVQGSPAAERTDADKLVQLLARLADDKNVPTNELRKESTVVEDQRKKDGQRGQLVEKEQRSNEERLKNTLGNLEETLLLRELNNILGIKRQVSSVEIRLVGGSNANEGRVEIYENGEWGSVCDDGWGVEDANVVCRELGLPEVNVQATSSAQFGQGEGAILLDDVSCTGDETQLSQCSHRGLGIHNCGHHEDAGVICGVSSVEIRLVDGSNANEGRVEIYENGVWGSVCDDGWDIDDATVVCRELGLSEGNVQATSSAQFGQGEGDIWLDDVACTGSENQLSQCPHGGVGSHNCNHLEDAGVICGDGTK